MKFNDKTKEIFISQYDYGIPIVFTAKSGFADGDKIKHNGKIWQSDIDNNVWEPGVYGWSEYEG